MSMYQNHWEGLVKNKLLNLIPRISDSLGLEWGPRICISNKTPGDTDAAGPEITAGEPISKNNLGHIKYPVSSEGMTQQTKSAEKNGILI